MRVPIEAVTTDECVALKVKLEKKIVNATLDSGAGPSVIDMGTVEILGLQHKITDCEDNLVNASGDKMDIAGVVQIQVKIQGAKPVKHEFKVLNAKTYSNVLLGRDFMKLFGTVTFDFVGNSVRLGRIWLRGVRVKNKEKVRISKKTVVPARSEQVVSVRCRDYCSLLEMDFQPKKLIGVDGVVVSKARVIPNMNGNFCVTVLNSTEHDIVLDNRRVVGCVTEADEVVAQIDRNNETVEEKLEQADNIVLGEDLSESQRKQIMELVADYKDIFAENPKNPKRTVLMKHKIITENALPVRKKSRRVPVAWEDEVNSQVKQMLKHNIIRPSCSPWNSPLLLVKKKDNSMRFVCDFRGLNDVTKKDNYPLPHIRDVVDKMEGSTFWTTLDAASAYWSMPLDEQDKEKTAFQVPRGKFEFNVTPYGLTNAGASYQRLMDICLSGLPSNRILAYMDDVVIFSRTFSEHIADIKEVFERFRAAKISLKASKCTFAAKTVDFLGYELSSQGIKPQNKLTSAIKEFPQPTNRKEVKRFLGMAGFYRNFVQGFGDISHPLNRLTCDNVKFEWTNECEIAFKTLKECLSSKPILAFPRLGEEFILDVDASDIAFGGVLMQEGSDSVLHPVGYFSDAVQKSQKSWSPTTKEAFAMVLAVRHWYVYLAGKHFTLNSDHNPLVYMRNQKDPRGKFARWILELEEYDYTVKYVKGVENVKADAMSRNTKADDQQPPSQLEEKIYLVLSNNNLNAQIKEEQLKDPITKNARDCIERGEALAKGRLKRVQKQMRIENDILTKSGRLIIPTALRAHILEKVHGVAHFGIDKTYALLKDRFYWPSMYGCTKIFVESCEECQKTKCLSQPPKAPLIPMWIPTKPMEFVAIDIAYMPKDSKGYQYFLLIGDIFSKYIQAVPLKEQTAPSVVTALNSNWIFFHGSPLYLLSDQGSNVDGETVKELCITTGIEKRRSSAYHSQGNGFAERNIRNVKEILRTVLLHRKLEQTKWRQILPELTFALNCSESTAIKCVPYNVVFGRRPVLPLDIDFGTKKAVAGEEVITPTEYINEVGSVLNDVFNHVVKHLQLSKIKMQKQYNKNLNFKDYANGEKVWLKVKFYKTGENRKLSPRRNGPWTVLSKLPNGVNFHIINDKTREEKIVHHDRINPVKGTQQASTDKTHSVPEPSAEVTESSDTDSDAHSDYQPSVASSSGEESSSDEDNVVSRYSQRNRTQRVIPGTVSWDDVDAELLG